LTVGYWARGWEVVVAGACNFQVGESFFDSEAVTWQRVARQVCLDRESVFGALCQVKGVIEC